MGFRDSIIRNAMTDHDPVFPLGKLPPEFLEQILRKAPILDDRVILGPGIGLDCAVLDLGENLLVFKAEPITFVTGEIGWYGIQVAANDIATTGALPRWYLATLLLPERRTTAGMVEEIARQMFDACQDMGITVIGGHTEITYGLDRPILVGTLVGEVKREELITPRGCRAGDRILLTKGVPIEATAILSREFPDRLRPSWTEAEITAAQDFLYKPGIGITKDARIALSAGRVTSMHDPTEGGLAAAVWEMARASGRRFILQPAEIPVPPLSARICREFGLDPLAAIASGALLMTTPEEDAPAIRAALGQTGITCAEIGRVEAGEAEVWLEDERGQRNLLKWPERDEITRVFE